jgi:8-oxo-dGTP diphosphatase
MIEHRQVFEAAIIVVLKKDQVLLHKRKNTGWMDGWYDAPSGHVEPGESILNAAAREVQEEAGIKVKAKDLKLFHISKSDTNKRYTYFIFKVSQWSGQPVLAEPDLAEDLDFYSIKHLPTKIPPYTKAGLDNINSDEITFSYFGPQDF